MNDQKNANSSGNERTVLTKTEQVLDALNSLPDSNLGKGVGAICDFSEHVTMGILSYARNRYAANIIETTKNEDLNNREKALAIGMQGIAVAPAYAQIVRCAVPIPAVQGIASISSVIGDFTDYKLDKRKRDRLRAKQITKSELLEIMRKLPDDRKSVYQHYLFSQSVIYDALYNYRKIIMNNAELTPIYKSEKIEIINKLITGLANESDVQNELIAFQSLKSDLEYHINDWNQDRIEKSDYEHTILDIDVAISLITEYEKGRVEFDLRRKKFPEIKEKMQQYHDLHKKIFSQDLPIFSKNKILELTENPSLLNEGEISLLRASMMNHHLNSSPKKQLELLDADMSNRVSKVVLNKQDYDNVDIFIKQPRVILGLLEQAREYINVNQELSIAEKEAAVIKLNDEIKRMTILLMSAPNENIHFDFERIDPELRSIFERSAEAQGDYFYLENLKNQIIRYEQAQQAFLDIFSSQVLHEGRSENVVENLKKSILMHKDVSLVQYSQSLVSPYENMSMDTVNSTPVITPSALKKIEVSVVKIVLDALNQNAEFDNLSLDDQKSFLNSLVTKTILESVLTKEGLERYQMEQASFRHKTQLSNELNSIYQKQTEVANELISGIYERSQLEKSVVVHKGIIVTDIGMMIASLVGTVVPPLAVITAPAVSVASIGIEGAKIGLHVHDVRTQRKIEQSKTPEEVMSLSSKTKKSITPYKQLSSDTGANKVVEPGAELTEVRKSPRPQK
ncbi:hypothetical protein CC99x_004815 [Candidatus Berkiella cookevillensis]|uniref:Uncharacterized protein n=1 Tax=Candidatus Berkiella cookevillensis TaxID=437022 RepID=A0A0Q9YHR9_9GAMM|nr:hypothetical protein [Candidatus Berkiella cookevillensis]MCS5708220.1 hypothetical protein [Candidatus Berkiella cookevillensis]